jgi:hypothetical protein
MAFCIKVFTCITGIDVDIEVRTRNKDEKMGDSQKEHISKDGKNNVSEEQTDAMEVDNKHDKETIASAGRSERESPENEGWTVVNEDTQQQSMISILYFNPYND